MHKLYFCFNIQQFINLLQEHETDDDISENILISPPEDLNLSMSDILNCTEREGQLLETFLNENYIRTGHMVKFN